jgi:hypothetical protein
MRIHAYLHLKHLSCIFSLVKLRYAAVYDQVRDKTGKCLPNGHTSASWYLVIKILEKANGVFLAQ